MTTLFTTRAGGVLLSGLLAACPVVVTAQSANGPGSPGGSVDMGIGDRDPRAVSLRRVEPGNGQFSFENRLTVANFNVAWSPSDPASPTATDFSTGLVHSQGYQYRSPGLRALIDRPEYVPLRTGGELMIIPANTVFQLTLERPTRLADPRPAAHDNFQDHRFDATTNPSTGSSTRSAGSFASGPAFQDLRLKRISASELRPIPHPTHMRFPQAAYPNGYAEPAAPPPIDRSPDHESAEPGDSPASRTPAETETQTQPDP